MNIHEFWNAVLTQNAKDLRHFFNEDAYINWHCTNEHFTVDEFIQANCEYPGHWDGNIERIEYLNDLIISVVNVFSTNHQLSFHVVSFIKIKDHKIISIDEYWGDDDLAPSWRLDKNIGTPII
ncbi:nuclear transport factor 2 family protein [Allocoprobacillus halotolerans]|uniref:Nuclear transport factor 2 family protein n=1 Tax=Allocoprobacillus halotolerans TaxID=2944914 RepID=A0ABY5I502_9FIRM|nr:nuclear transport factor 2 family protein [Allocoprobacillus halotolerans]UTY40401.1 nuclear transport factor 2 family protein [Allocoprobacillus halotolerans]